jgi:predicted transcriptional regulator
MKKKREKKPNNHIQRNKYYLYTNKPTKIVVGTFVVVVVDWDFSKKNFYVI